MSDTKHMSIVEQSLIPNDINIAVSGIERPHVSSGQPANYKMEETKIGRRLIADIVKMNYGDKDFEIHSEKDKKPTAYYDGKPIYISIAHCRSMVCGAVSMEREVGIDIEHRSRPCYQGLQKRILNESEGALLTSFSVLQLWTIKEAALKWSGDGLRTAMKKIRIVEQNDPLYHIEFPDGHVIEICSFHCKNHWLSVAYNLD
jgi:phosphopantetheinyl transferase